MLGAQGNLWGEYMPTPTQAEYMLLPRMLALSEVLWSPSEKRNWADFEKRLATHLERMAILDVNYRGRFNPPD